MTDTRQVENDCSNQTTEEKHKITKKILEQLRVGVIMGGPRRRRILIPVSSVFRKKVDETVPIFKRAFPIHHEKPGFDTKATILLKVDPKHYLAIANHISNHPSVNALYLVDKGYDFKVDAAFKDVEDVEKFLVSLAGVIKISRMSRSTSQTQPEVKRS